MRLPLLKMHYEELGTGYKRFDVRSVYCVVGKNSSGWKVIRLKNQD